MSLHQSYKLYGDYRNYYINNNLATARYKHLVELMFERGFYIEGTDYKSLFLKEFRNRIDNVAGKDVKIWDGVKDNILEDWIRRGEDKKKLSEKDWYSKYYKNFYEQTYLPYMDNFVSYLLEGSSAPKSDFWRWYLNAYLRENKYP